MLMKIITDTEKLIERCEEINIEKNKVLVREVIRNLKETIEENNLRGLAANQIGYSCRIMCLRYDNKIVEYINPIIVEMSGFGFAQENCSSIPSKTYLRPRYSSIKVVYQDKKGNMQSKQLIGLASQMFQHEIDHLDGMLISDIGLEIDDDFNKASDEEKDEIILEYSKYLDKLQEKYQEEINNDSDLKQMSDAIEFMKQVQKGEVQVEA